MNEIKDLSAKLHRFAALLNLQQLGALKTDGTDCEANRINRATSVKIGPKYSRVDIGNSGRYMVVNATGEIFGVKAYGVIHKGHAFGTLDTIQDWDWSGYRAVRLAPRFAPPREIAAKVAAGVSYNDPAPSPAPEPAPKPSEPAALKPGDRVSATIHGVPKQGTVDHLGTYGTIFLRWDGAKAVTWAHRQSLTKIEEFAWVTPGDIASVSVVDAIRDGINSLTRLPDAAGAYRAICLKQLEQALPKAKALVDALEKIRIGASANSYQIQYEADNLEGLIKTIFNIADEALKAGVAP